MTFRFMGVRAKRTYLFALNVQNRPALLLTTAGTINFRYKNVTQSSFFFRYKNVTQSVWLFVY